MSIISGEIFRDLYLNVKKQEDKNRQMYTTGKKKLMFVRMYVIVNSMNHKRREGWAMAKTNLKTLAYKTIREKIVSCQYAPGTYLNEEILTEELKIGRTPIRDALSRLEQEGLVTIKPKKGITVTGLSLKDVNMIFEIRKLYEPYILKNYGNVLPEDKLHEFYCDFSRKGKDDKCFQDCRHFYERDAAFHQMIVDTCPNIYMRQNYASIQTQNERFRFMTGDISESRLADTCSEHVAVIVPCLEKDWDTAVEKLAYHLEESKKSTFQLIFDSIDQNNIGL